MKSELIIKLIDNTNIKYILEYHKETDFIKTIKSDRIIYRFYEERFITFSVLIQGLTIATIGKNASGEITYMCGIYGFDSEEKAIQYINKQKQHFTIKVLLNNKPIDYYKTRIDINTSNIAYIIAN